MAADSNSRVNLKVVDVMAPPTLAGPPRRPLVSDSFAARVNVAFSAAICFALIGFFGIRITRVIGFSMEPTIENHDGLFINRLAYEVGAPRRGDIVSLYYPPDPDRVLIKRVIAESGDRVRIVRGRVFVNETPLRDDYVQPTFRGAENWGPDVVPDGYYFVLGDHRNSSSDSRDWGPVPKKYIIGKVKFRWWPLDHLRIF